VNATVRQSPLGEQLTLTLHKAAIIMSGSRAPLTIHAILNLNIADLPTGTWR
jgi:hypothetical protein